MTSRQRSKRAACVTISESLEERGPRRDEIERASGYAGSHRARFNGSNSAPVRAFRVDLAVAARLSYPPQHRGEPGARPSHGLILRALNKKSPTTGRGASRRLNRTSFSHDVRVHATAGVPAMPPLALSDDQLTAIMQAAAPLPFNRRAAFLEEIAAQLRGREIGDGLVHRVIAQVQHAHFDPPDF
jgi:hypothetical protein